MVGILIDKSGPVVSIYDYVKRYTSNVAVERTKPGQCSYYKLKEFVPFSDPIDEATLDRCHDNSNWKLLPKHNQLEEIFDDDLQKRHIHVVVILPIGQFSVYQCESVLKVSHRSNSRYRRQFEAESCGIV